MNREPHVGRVFILPLPRALVLLSDLPIEDLERVVEDAFDLGHEAGLPISEIEQEIERLLISGIRSHWSIDAIRRAARQAVLALALGNEYAMNHPAENTMADASNDPTPQYIHEPVAPRNIIEAPAQDRRTPYSVELEISFQTDIALLFTPFRCIMFFVLLGAWVVVTKDAVAGFPNWTLDESISSMIDNIPQQVRGQTVISWEPFSVGLSRLGSFPVTPEFINVLSNIIGMLLLAHFVWLILVVWEGVRIHCRRA